MRYRFRKSRPRERWLLCLVCWLPQRSQRSRRVAMWYTHTNSKDAKTQVPLRRQMAVTQHQECSKSTERATNRQDCSQDCSKSTERATKTKPRQQPRLQQEHRARCSQQAGRTGQTNGSRAQLGAMPAFEMRGHQAIRLDARRWTRATQK